MNQALDIEVIDDRFDSNGPAHFAQLQGCNMSYYISLYAEYRIKGEQQWKLVGDTSITDDFAFFMVGNPGDWTESDRFNSFDQVDPSTLSPGLKAHFPTAESRPERFRQLSIGEYVSRLDTQIKEHRDRIKTTLVALGMSAHYDDDNLVVSDDWRIDDECSATMRENRKGSQLTFPVNKELICDIVMEDIDYSRALQNKGIVSVIYEMVTSHEAELVEIRLIAVN